MPANTYIATLLGASIAACKPVLVGGGGSFSKLMMQCLVLSLHDGSGAAKHISPYTALLDRSHQRMKATLSVTCTAPGWPGDMLIF